MIGKNERGHEVKKQSFFGEYVRSPVQVRTVAPLPTQLEPIGWDFFYSKSENNNALAFFAIFVKLKFILILIFKN